MVKRIQFHEKAKGVVSENEDWWHLYIEDDGEQYVVHSWQHLDGKTLKIREGKERLEVSDVLSGGLGYKLKTVLDEL